MNFRYNYLQRLAKRAYRRCFPVPKSPWTSGYVKDIYEVNLTPPEELEAFFLNAIKILQKAKGEDIGDYLEFGVFNGSSLSCMYRAAKKQRLLSRMRFFGFDSFEGLPAEAEKEDDGVWRKGYYACSFEDMANCLRRSGISPEDISWVKGWYSSTLNELTIKEYKLKKLAIVFVDCDTYTASKQVLDFIAPLINEETILCLDDWKLNNLDIKGMGEYRAFNEFIETNRHLRATEIKSYSRKSKSFMVKPF